MATHSQSPMNARSAGIVCATVAILLYLNTLDCEFCFDDISAIEKNQDLQPQTPWSDLLQNDFWGRPMHSSLSHKSYRPLCVATFRLNYLVHELQPMGYHLVNVLLHSAVCYLYVQLCGLVFREVWPALIAGLLFAVHPVHTEAVSGLVGRAESLSSLFFLLVIFSYRQAVRSNGYRWVVASLVLTLCALLSKEQGITVVAVCMTYDLFLAPKRSFLSFLGLFSSTSGTQPQQKAQKYSWSSHILVRGITLAVFTVVVMSLRFKIMDGKLPGFDVHDNPAVALETPYRQLHWLYLCFVNSWLLLNPAFLCVDWTMGTIPLIMSLSDPRNMLTIATFAVVAILGIYGISGASRQQKAALLALSLIIFPYIPASNLLFPVGFTIAERVLYIPSMGFCMLVALGFSRVKTSGLSKKLMKLGLVVLLLSHSAKVLVRNRDWYSNFTIFRSGISINRGNGKLYMNMGHEYEGLKDYQMVEELIRMGMQIQPDNVVAYANLGRILSTTERYDESEKAFKSGIDLLPEGKNVRMQYGSHHLDIHYDLATLIKRDPERLEEALVLYDKSLRVRPNHLESLLYRGEVLMRLNRSAEAIQSFEMAVNKHPESPDAYYNLAAALAQNGQKAEAEKMYRKAYSLNSGHIHTLMSLAALLKETKQRKKLKEAEQLLNQALSLQPGNLKAAYQLALVYWQLEDVQKSEQALLRILELKPNYRPVLHKLGELYYSFGRYSEAVERLSQLVQLYPNHLEGTKLLGDCYVKLNQLEKAKLTYELVLQLKPNKTFEATILSNMGDVYKGLGDLSSANEYYKRVAATEGSSRM